MEQRLDRALITTMAFGLVAVATVAGIVSAIECGLAAGGCYYATGWVQRHRAGRRVAAPERQRRRIRELDRDLSRRAEAPKPRRDRPARPTPAPAPLLFDADELSELLQETSYGW